MPIFLSDSQVTILAVCAGIIILTLFLHYVIPLIRTPTHMAAFVVFLLGTAISIVGYIDQHQGPFTLERLIEDFYANASTELWSIAITVLIIERLEEGRRNRQRQQDEERQQVEETRKRKHDLLISLGSNVNATALDAAWRLHKAGWLSDGTASGQYLQSANLRKAPLEDADLSDSDLRKAEMTRARLARAKFDRSDLRGVMADMVDAMNVNFRGAKMRRCHLSGARLLQADFSGADLRKAVLHKAILIEADLGGANLAGANLCGADLSKANLIGVRFEDAKVEPAFFDERTRLPDGSRWRPDTDMTKFTKRAYHAEIRSRWRWVWWMEKYTRRDPGRDTQEAVTQQTTS